MSFGFFALFFILNVVSFYTVIFISGISYSLFLNFSVLIIFVFTSIFSWFISKKYNLFIIHRSSQLIKHIYSEVGNKRDPSFGVDLPEDLRIVFDDVANRYRLNMNQTMSEQTRLKNIIDGISEGILVTGSNNRIELANHALTRMFSSDGDITKRPLAELVRNSDILKAIEGCMVQQRGVEIETRIMLESSRTFEVKVRPIITENRCVGVVTLFFDITQLRQLEHMRRDFVANVSHELRTPLTAIKGYAETLNDEHDSIDPADSSRFIGIITTHADRLNRLLDDLLDLARVESDQFVVEQGRYKLGKIFQVCIESVDSSAKEKSIEIVNEVSETVEILCDSKLIEQALINLLDNAVKYTTEGGKVFVKLRQENSLVWVDIKDTGIGIPSTDLDRIFERFYRVDKGRSREMGGTGLGLAIVRHIVEAHGQEIKVKSELGLGTTFSISFSSPSV